MIEAFLRRRPHEDTVVDFTGVAIDDYSVAIIAGFNWLDHCALLAGVDPDKFWRPLRNFRKIVLVAQRWWALDGAGPRCNRMLVERQYPPLMVYLIWLGHAPRQGDRLRGDLWLIDRPSRNPGSRAFRAELAGRPAAELASALDALTDTMGRLRSAHEPDDLLPR